MQENNVIGWNTIGDKMPIFEPYYESFKEEFPTKIKKKICWSKFQQNLHIYVKVCVYI